MAAQIEPLAPADEGETVAPRVARVLQIHLPVVLRRRHVGRIVADRDDALDRIGKQLAARERRQQPVARLQPASAHQRIVQLADHRVRLAVRHFGAESHQAVFDPDRQREPHLQLRPARLQRPVAQHDLVGRLFDAGHVLRARDRNLLLAVLAVEIEPPQRPARRVIMPGPRILERRQIPLGVHRDF
jgi:hypothetical protein